MKNVPVWIDDAPIRKFPKLQRNMSVDVLVAGAGVTGITTAYLLKKAGPTVALIERDQVGSIDTGRTTAHLLMLPMFSSNDLYAILARITRKRRGMPAQPRSMKLRGLSKKKESNANSRAVGLGGIRLNQRGTVLVTDLVSNLPVKSSLVRPKNRCLPFEFCPWQSLNERVGLISE